MAKVDLTKIDNLELKAEREFKRLQNAKFCLQRASASGLKTIYHLIKSPKDYLTAISILSPQSKATKIEDLVRDIKGYEKVSASDNRGDAYNPNTGEYIEFKISTTNEDCQINAVQLRPWQNIDKYLIGYIDEDNFMNTHFFLLTKEELEEEIKLLGVSAMHGTKEANSGNKNVELALRIPVDANNPVFIRWCEKYSYEELNDYIRGK